MKLEVSEMSSFEMKCISFKKKDPKILRVEVEQKGSTKVFKIRMEDFARISIHNNTDLTFKVNQKDFESYGEFVSAKEKLSFFWDDPFSEQTVFFQRIFNNKISDEKVTLELNKITKRTSKLVELNPNNVDSKESDHTTGNNDKVRLEIVIEKIIRTDSITIDINYYKPTALRRMLQPSRRPADPDLNTNILKVFLYIKSAGISLIDEKPKEILYINLEGFHLSQLYRLDELSLVDLSFVLMDLQADFQINKRNNKVCIITQRRLKNTKYAGLHFWSNTAAPAPKPCIKIEVNFFTHAYNRLVNIRSKLSKFIVNLDGAAFSKLYPLIILFVNISIQARNIFLTAPATSESLQNLDNSELFPLTDDQELSVSKQKLPITSRYNVFIKDFEIDLFLEKVPELISSLSNDYVAKIFSMLFSDICYFPIRLKEFSSETVRALETVNRSMKSEILRHYSSQIGVHVIDLLSNTKLFGNPAKIFANLHDVLLNSFKDGREEDHSNTQKIFRESFITMFHAHSKASGNFEHELLSSLNESNSRKDKNNQEKISIGNLISGGTQSIIHKLYSLPFAGSLIPKRGSSNNGEASKALVSGRKPHRHPRFFFKNKILIPYSSLKAQLQMVVDNRDIETGTFFFLTEDDVILLANSKIYIVNKLIDHPVACIELDQIFSVQFVEQEELEAASQFSQMAEAEPLQLEEGSGLLKIIYYDKSKFTKELSRSKDPFDAASKYLKIKFKNMNPKVQSEFEQRIALEKKDNFASFF